MSWRVTVDLDRCEGNALCMGRAPEVFRVDDQEQIELLVEEPDDASRARVQAAVDACPRQAIAVVESP